MSAAGLAEIVIEQRAAELPTEVVRALAVDDAGWLWVGTHAGLFRYDGRKVVRWGGAAPSVEIADILQVEADRALVLTGTGALEQHTPDARQTAGGGAPLGVTQATLDAEGAAWALVAGRLWRGTDPLLGPWQPVDRAPERIYGLWADGEAGVWVATADAAVLLDAAGAELLRVPMSVPRASAAGSGERQWFVDDETRVLSVSAAGTVEDHGRLDRGGVTALAEHQGALWVALGSGLWVLPPDAAPQEVGLGSAMMGVMELESSPDGTLWLGAMQGLFALLAPETRLWSERSGLPDRGIRALTLADPDGDSVILSTWRGPAWVARDTLTVTAVPPAYTEGEACWDGGGRLWVGGVYAHGELPELLDPRGGARRPLPPETARYWDCAPAGDGGLWLGTSQGVAHLTPDGEVRATALPIYESIRVYEDGQGEVWASSWEDTCHAPRAAILAGASDWTCEALPTGARITDVLEVEGRLWASATGAGLLERTAAGVWQVVPAAERLPTRDLLWMSASPRGGVWLAGHGTLLRVRPSADAAGWTVLERLGPSQGMPSRTGSHVVESPTGALWVASSEGLVSIPPAARRPAADPPAPVLSELRLAGHAQSPAAALSLGWQEGPLALEYSVAALREPQRLRFRVRTHPDAPWSEPSETPTFQLLALPEGAQVVQAQAALEDGPWSPPSAPLALTVAPPWYRLWWARLLGASLLVLLARLAWRIRLALALRLERERSRIALDLHDELGSGLGSISILAGLAAQEELEEDDRRSAAEDAARVAGELGQAMQDIVWSLRQDAGDASALLDYLATRGQRLLADGQAVFSVERPARERLGRVDLRIRREVQLMVSEALHNAARHASATRVALRFRVEPGRRWIIEVEDDGLGMQGESRRPGGGNGLESIRQRAERIGASVAWLAGPRGGTCFTVEFTPTRRLWR